MVSNKFLLAACLGLAAVSTTKAAIVFATNPTGGGGTVAYNTIGTPFTLTAGAVTIGALGVFDTAGDGLLSAHAVGIYDAAQTLLGSVTVPAGTGADLHDGTRWVNLTPPLTLFPGQNYMLAVSFVEAPEPVYAPTLGQITIASDFALGTGWSYTPGTALSFPINPLASGQYIFGGNMEVAAVPEPATLLPALCLTGSALMMRRRGKKPV